MLKNSSFNIFPAYDIPEQIRRRVETNADANSLSVLSNLFGEYGEEAKNQQAYISTLADICKYSSSPDGYEVPIVDISGVNEDGSRAPVQAYNRSSRIYNFVAELVTRSPNEMSLIETSYVVSGYTSEAEPSFTGLLPDDMVMYINDIHGIQTIYERLPGGGLTAGRQRSIDNYVLANVLESVSPSKDPFHPSAELLVNPGSIAASGVTSAQLDLAGDESLGENVVLAQVVPSPQAGAQIYNSSITRPEMLLQTVASSYINYEVNKGDTEDDLASRIFSNPSTSVMQYVASNRLVNAFSSHEFTNALTAGLRRTGGGSERTCSEVESSAKFTLGSFKAAIENPYDVDSQISAGILQAKRSMDKIDTQATTDNWVGRNGYSTQGSIVAFEIAMRVGAIMSSNLVGRVSFGYVTLNADQMSKAEFYIVPNSVGELSKSGLTRALMQRFISSLESMLYQATSYNRIPLEVVVKTVLGSVSRIEIRLDGEQWEYYTHAAFMTNRMHLGITNDLRYVNGLSYDAGKLFSSISDGFSSFGVKSNQSKIKDYLGSGNGVGSTGSVLDQVDSPSIVPDVSLGDNLSIWGQ